MRRKYEAGAGWVFGTVSLFALIASYFRRKRPNRVIVEDIRRFESIAVHDDVKAKVNVQFDGAPVKGFSMVRAVTLGSRHLASIAESEMCVHSASTNH